MNELAEVPTDALPAVLADVKEGKSVAQAKVDAINHLTMEVYSRASMLKITPEEQEKLEATFPDEAFRSGAAGKENLIYIEHAHLRRRLNEVFGPGQWSIVPRSRWTEQNGNSTKVYVEAMLCIRGCFVDEAIGDMDYHPSNASMNFGDAVEGAKTQALRRCCKTLGIGLQAWERNWCDGWWQRRTGKAPQSHPEAQGGTPAHSKASSSGPLPNCPKCGKGPPTVIRGKAEYGGGFVCWKNKEGCGNKWQAADAPQKATVDEKVVDVWKKRLGGLMDLEAVNTMLGELKAEVKDTPTLMAIWKLFNVWAAENECEFDDKAKRFVLARF